MRSGNSLTKIEIYVMDIDKTRAYCATILSAVSNVNESW